MREAGAELARREREVEEAAGRGGSTRCGSGGGRADGGGGRGGEGTVCDWTEAWVYMRGSLMDRDHGVASVVTV